MYCLRHCMLPFPLAPTYLFLCYFKHSQANFTLCTSHRMPLAFLFNVAVHINQIKSSVSKQSCIHFFTFLNQAGSSISTSLSCSPLRQPCWRFMSSKLAQLTKYGRPKKSTCPFNFSVHLRGWFSNIKSAYIHQIIHLSMHRAERWKKRQVKLRANVNLSAPSMSSHSFSSEQSHHRTVYLQVLVLCVDKMICHE